MARRAPYTKVQKSGRSEAAKGLGDVPFTGFQCPTLGCEEWHLFRTAELDGEFSFTCLICNETYGRGDAVKLFDYNLIKNEDAVVIQSGIFELLLDDYIAEAGKYKYCVLCCTLKPIDAFAKHEARVTGRQSECRLCKTLYNSIKNQTRLTDQHREAAQKRRLVVELGGTSHFDSAAVRARFEDKCFKCGRDVSDIKQAQFDHTLPVRYFWPMTTETATLLCAEHNGQKGASWPRDFYSDGELRRLALLTGISYDSLADDPQINPDALLKLRDSQFVDDLVEKFAHYMDEIILIRNRILDMTGFDFFESSTNISQKWRDQANRRRPHQSPIIDGYSGTS